MVQTVSHEPTGKGSTRRFDNLELRPWLVVIAATTGMAAAYGGISTIAVLVGPFEAEFGWARAEISSAYVLLTIGIAIGGLGAGRLADGLPSGPVTAAGAAMLGLGMIALALQSSMRMMQATYLVMGFLGFSFLYAPLLTTVSLWFRRGHGFALGLVTAGGALGQAGVPPLFQNLILDHGWRAACASLGLGYIVLLAPAMLLVGKPALPTTGTGSQARLDAAWAINPVLGVGLLGVAGLTCCALMGLPSVHLMTHVASLGLSLAQAASVVTVAMLAGAVGRIATGLIVDRLGSLRAYALAALLQTLTVYGFAVADDLWSLYAVGAIYGLGFGGVMTGLVCAVRDAVPARFVGTAMAVVGLMTWAGMAIGGYQGGLCFDLTGSYELSFSVAVAAGGANLICLSFLGLLVRRQRHPGSVARNSSIAS